MSLKVREQVIDKELLSVEEAPIAQAENDDVILEQPLPEVSEAPVDTPAEASLKEDSKVIERHYYYGSAYAPNSVSHEAVSRKAPKGGIVRNEYGDKIGYLKKGKLYYKTGEYWGFLNKTHRGIIINRRGEEDCYLDANNNILTLSNDYVGTIEAKKVSPAMLLIAILLILAVGLTSVLVAHVLSLKAKREVPTFEFGTASSTGMHEFVIFERNSNGDALLYPGINGSCDFIMTNTSSYELEFGLALDEMIETYNPDYEGARLPMKYALYKDGVPVIGNMEKLLDIEFFYLPDNITIQPGSKSRFTLLWLWESESDEKDVDIASSVKSYTLIVNVTAGMSD